MDKHIYKKLREFTQLIAVLGLLAAASSCKKNSELVNPSISYGITGVEPSMAGTGDTIKIYGQGFDGTATGNTVKVNGVSATVVSASANILNVVVPQAPKNGNVSIQTGSNTNTYNKNFTITTVITGNQPTSTWSADKTYLLKGISHFTTGTTLTIQPGTVILADKNTTASLIIDDGATVVMNGTAAKPIVFSSNQLVNVRLPGDWTGITLAPSATTNDVINYVRIEYAGYHKPNIPGAALQISRGTKAGNIQYIQTSYSYGDGFRCNAGGGAVQYLKYLVAFGCAGNDFTFTNNVRAYAQFLLGYKDPAYADPLGADGLLVQSAQPVTVTNLSLLGYSGIARKDSPNFHNYDYNIGFSFDDEVVNTNAGRGVHIGGLANNNGLLAPATGTLQLFNSMVAAPWLAGISVDGAPSWNQYENGTTGSIIRKTTITYSYVDNQGPWNYVYAIPQHPPYRGYSFSKENVVRTNIGFESGAGSAQQVNFNKYNDTVKLTLTEDQINSNKIYDDLGLVNFGLYSKITNPLMTPPTGSKLLSGADFTPAMLGDAFFDKTPLFRGAFGTSDWTKPWANYTPLKTAY